MRTEPAPQPQGQPHGQRATTGLRAQAQPRRRRVYPRYTSLISLLKLLLPSIAAVLIILVAIWPQIQPRTAALPLAAISISQEELESLAMINARYIGLDNGSQPYTVTADIATQVGPKSDLIQLQSPTADITLENGTWIALTAESGDYRQKEQTIELEGDVNLFHDAGYEFHSESAFIDLADGSAFGFEPVTGQGPFGAVSSIGFQVLDQGERIVFTGPARLVLFPGSRGGGQ
jgi:lipopolysaccharide export system protein LptC